MGRCIDFLSFPYKTNKNQILAEIQEWAACNVDRGENPFGSYHNNFIFEDNREFKTRKEAESYLNSLGKNIDRGVIYYEYPKISPTALIKKIDEQIQKIANQAIKFGNSHTVQSQKSDFIGCKTCNSKVNKSYLRSRASASRRPGEETEFLICDNKAELYVYYQKCPVCEKDLRADYIISQMNDYKKKIDDLLIKRAKLVMAQNDKNFSKAEKFWLCKVEVHC